MTTPPTSSALPELDDDRIAAMESALFDRIRDEQVSPATTAGRARRGRVWLGALGGAAAVAVAVLVVPAVVAGSSGSAGSSSAGPAYDESGIVSPDVARGEAFSSADGAVVSGESAAQDTATREVIATGSATVRVDDVAAAIALIGQDAEARGGFVESTGTDVGTPVPIDGGIVYDSPVEVGTTDRSGFITIRVPSDELADATAALSEVGEVTSSSVSRQDVTDQTIDLRARVESLQASVDRLTALIAQAQSVADVVAIESELSARQADLESYQQQLQYLEGQISLSSLTVTVVPDTQPVTADPAGFGDGLAAGWNGLVATLNALVIAVGFLLPWIAVAAVAALVVWLIVRARRRRAAAAAAVRSNETDAAD